MASLIRVSPESYCPFVIWGDDAPTSRRVGRNVRELAFYSPFSEGDADFKRVPMAVLQNGEAMAKHTEHVVKQTIVWSCNAAMRNRHPHSGPYETQALQKTLQTLSGQPIRADGVTLTFAGFTGDWAFVAADFDMEWHYNTEQVCHMCKAAKHGAVLNLSDASENAAWNKPENARSLADYITSLISRGRQPEHWNPLTSLCGFHTHGFFEDQLHCDCLGIRQHCNGSSLVSLCFEGTWGDMSASGTWSDKLDSVLATAHVAFSVWCTRNQITTSHPVFNCLNLHMHKASDYAQLKSKGHNSAMITKWLLTVCEDAVDVSKPESGLRFSLMWGLNALWDIPHDCRPRFVYSDAEAVQLETARKVALMSLYGLHKFYAMKGEHLFNIVPKFHQVDHMCRRQIRSKLACSLWWCFASESAIGSVARTAGKTHGASTNRRAVQRWITFFWGSFINSD